MERRTNRETVRGGAAMRGAATAALAVAGLLAAGPAMAKGMPQLDFANPLTIAQVVWLAIVFVVLYVLLSQWALPQVADVLEVRAKAIASDLDAARQAKTEADQAVAELTRATREAHAGAQAEIQKAVDEAKAAAEAQSATLNARLNAQIAEAEQRIAQARAAAMGALEQVASTTAFDVVARLGAGSVPENLIRQAVAAELAARAA